jgi:hypothetical protein
MMLEPGLSAHREAWADALDGADMVDAINRLCDGTLKVER